MSSLLKWVICFGDSPEIGWLQMFPTAAELKVFRVIHHPHAPSADLAQDVVVGNCLTHRLGGRSP
jgi:hypothetical protein